MDVLEVELYDHMGRLMMAACMPPQQNFQLQLDKFDQGIYFIAVRERGQLIY